MTELPQLCIQENSRSAQIQEKYTKPLQRLRNSLRCGKSQVDTLQKKNSQRLTQVDTISRFMLELTKRTESITEFDEGPWLVVVDKATSFHDELLVFIFQDRVALAVKS